MCTVYLYHIVNVYILVPRPNVLIKTSGEQGVGQSLELECNVQGLIDADTTVNITWTVGDNEVRRIENIPEYLLKDYSDFFTIPLLSRNEDNNIYQCKVITNTSPLVTTIGDFELTVICKFEKEISVLVTNDRITSYIKYNNYDTVE